MQKLNQRRLDSRVCLIKNMVGPEAVDADLQQDVTGQKITKSLVFLVRFGIF